MTAHDQMRAMLDQLMGTGRNGETNKFNVRFDDNRVCKSFLLGCCPHDILSSTRMDLGECPKIHDLALRADYANASKERDYFYDIDATEHLQAFIADCDRRTESAKQRLLETQEELSAEVAEKANNVHELAEQIGAKLARAEQLGADGFVEESMKLMGEIDESRKKKAEAEEVYRNSMPASSYQQQKLRVCEVCSAYLGIHDNDRRLADHFGGKLHLGFIKIREKLAELEKNLEARKDARRDLERTRYDKRAPRNNDRERERDRYVDRGDRLDRYERNDRNDRNDRNRLDRRDKDKYRKERYRSRSRSPNRHRSRRSRSNSRSAKSRSTSRDRKQRVRRSHSREKRRDKR